MTDLSYVPHAATLSNLSRDTDQHSSGWWANYWAGGWDLYLHNARAIADAFTPARTAP